MERGYGQYCPLSLASEIVAERWTPLVLRELLFGSTSFNDILRGVPLISRSLLSKRLRDLERAGLVERRASGTRQGYHLTDAGEELRPLMVGLAEWGMRWARSELRKDQLDPRPLVWDMRRSMNHDALPDHRVVLGFVFTDAPKAALRRSWMILDRDSVEVCYKDPGFETDLIVTGSVRTVVGAWLGDLTWEQALAQLEVDGPRHLRSALPSWFGLSIVAGAQYSTPAAAG